MKPNTAVKYARFGRWTAQKRAAFYLGRYVIRGQGELFFVLFDFLKKYSP